MVRYSMVFGPIGVPLAQIFSLGSIENALRGEDPNKVVDFEAFEDPYAAALRQRLEEYMAASRQQYNPLLQGLQGVAMGSQVGSGQEAARQATQRAMSGIRSIGSSARGFGGAGLARQAMQQAMLAGQQGTAQQSLAAIQDREAAQRSYAQAIQQQQQQQLAALQALGMLGAREQQARISRESLRGQLAAGRKTWGDVLAQGAGAAGQLAAGFGG